MTSVTYPGPSTTTYDFDAFGNRTEMDVSGNATTYAYDDADRITTVTPPSPASAISYTWDDNGNLTDRGSDSFDWDYEDRMVSATVNSVTTTFAYRGDGLRDSRTVGMTTTTFTWDIAGGLPVVLDDGNQYVYGAGLTAMKQSGNWYYYLADGLGSTMAVVDASGNSQKSYEYDVYGEVTGGSGSLGNEFDFAGQQTDGTGLQYLRARYYDPETGTFLSRDPMATNPEWVAPPFGYSYSNPASRVDPLGLDSPWPSGWGIPHPCDIGAVNRMICDRGAELAGAAVDAISSFMSTFSSSMLRLLSLIGEKGKALADAIKNSAIDWISDPLNRITVGLIVAEVTAKLACGAAVASGGALIGACAAAVVAYGTALKLRYDLLKSKHDTGEVSDRQLACQVATDIVSAASPYDPGVFARVLMGEMACRVT
ncbi:MAG: RHS repeat domain-containing protein [Dehalococcoidia bacterium]